MFAPKWKKEAKMLEKASKKFLNYKRDLLDEKQIAEIESRRDDLRKARKSGGKDKAEEAGKQLQATCESALPRYQAQGWFEENLEVFFVAIVVALGLRAYVVQPFKIPTASMQPTLNGYVAYPVEDADALPSLPTKAMHWATHGRTYVDIVLDEDKVLRKKDPIVETTLFLHFFVRTHVYFEDGSRVTFSGPKSALLGYRGMGLGKKLLCITSDMTPDEVANLQRKVASLPGSDPSYDTAGNRRVRQYYNRKLPKGTVIARGYVASGDLILVDKISYHFRSPKRGEVFVFDTRKIRGIHEGQGQGGQSGSHYIKRLGGVPGDKLELRDPQPDGSGTLYINGKPATGFGFQRVMSKEGDYRGYGVRDRLGVGQVMHARRKKIPGMNEYIALGDNSFQSSDSRSWGYVKEFNLIGPASFSLWPFGSGHWGVIK